LRIALPIDGGGCAKFWASDWNKKYTRNQGDVAGSVG